MFKFNNNHIFTGYLKQLLSSFNLPKCRVYTKEQQLHHQKYLANSEAWLEKSAYYKGLVTLQQDLSNNITELNSLLKNQALDSETKEDLEKLKKEYSIEFSNISKELLNIELELLQLQPEINVLQTNPHSSYEIYPNSLIELPTKLTYEKTMRYIPYIKDGYLQVYTDGAWHKCHNSFGAEHGEFHENKNNPYTTINYSYGQKILNYTKNLQIQNTIYDSYTHEYLGDYLRFHRDFANINLMPLYNCFSNRACPHLDLEFEVGNNYTAKFKTDQSFETTLYKYYMVPVKFFKDYTIAIDSEASIEVCCCLYDEYDYNKYGNHSNKELDFVDVPKLTYQCFGNMQFRSPILYSGLQKLNPKLFTQGSDFCQYESDLKLILKIPANNKSSIVILEGDYTTYNDMSYTQTIGEDIESANDLDLLLLQKENMALTELEALLDDIKAKKDSEFKKGTSDEFKVKATNKTVINYENLDACEYLSDKLITPLQLLRTNTGESYPFADRLVEYLVGNAITVNEEIKDNVVRAKTVISKNCPDDIYSIVAEDGIWEPILQCLVYDFINKNHNVNDINHDILGFIDKDTEKWYAKKYYAHDGQGKLKLDADNKPIVTQVETIANIDIYTK